MLDFAKPDSDIINSLKFRERLIALLANLGYKTTGLKSINISSFKELNEICLTYEEEI